MYRTCLFCTRDLGSNQTLEVFPIGRRLAFDQAKGRLWVICPRCCRWNLSPLEERWEAIDACERAYRETRTRASTGNIGLARVGDGLELVRIGRPQRPEMAAWRYGSTFVRRHRKYLVGMTLATGVWIPLLWSGAFAAVAASGSGIGLLIQVPGAVSAYRERRRVLASVRNDEAVFVVRGKHLESARLAAAEGADDEAWALSINSDNGPLSVEGGAAYHVAGAVLARINATGASPALVRRAVNRLEEAGGPAGLLTKTAAGVHAGNADTAPWRWSSPLRWMEKDERIALEMATHEELERRALESELKALELAWIEAERIAAISDDLLVPPRAYTFLERHRR